jgi:hypothetical protein
MRPKLGGWTRLGIVFSIIWFVVFGGYLLLTTGDEFWAKYRSNMDLCYLSLDWETAALDRIASDDARDQRRSYNTKTFETCLSNARDAVDKNSTALRDLLLLWLAIDFATVLIGWLVVGFVIGVVRWVRSGFA